MVRETPELGAAGPEAPRGLLRTPGGRRTFFLLLYFTEGAPIGYVWWALPTRLREAGVPIEQVTALPAVLAMATGALVGGRLSDRAPRAQVLAASIAALAAGVLALALVARLGYDDPARWLLPALAAVYVLFGIYTACAYALFMEVTDPELGGVQFSAYMAGVNLCSVWSAAAVGSLAGAYGYSVGIGALALASLLALPLLRTRAFSARTG